MSKPKILLYDIETLPNIGYTWGKWEQNVIQFVKEWELASFAYKWLGSKDIYCITRQDMSEKQMVKELRDLMDKADITIAHNGDEFDLKKARAKFLEYGLKPPTISRSIDTKKIARSQFSFNSNSLNDLGTTLGLGKKVDTGGFELWVQCMAGNKKAWDKMAKYNRQDVLLLEQVYLKFRAWMPNHPNLALLDSRDGCPVCSGNRVISNGFRANARGRQQRWRCQDCGHSYTGRLDKNA